MEWNEPNISVNEEKEHARKKNERPGNKSIS